MCVCRLTTIDRDMGGIAAEHEKAEQEKEEAIQVAYGGCLARDVMSDTPSASPPPPPHSC